MTATNLTLSNLEKEAMDLSDHVGALVETINAIGPEASEEYREGCNHSLQAAAVLRDLAWEAYEAGEIARDAAAAASEAEKDYAEKLADYLAARAE